MERWIYKVVAAPFALSLVVALANVVAATHAPKPREQRITSQSPCHFGSISSRRRCLYINNITALLVNPFAIQSLILILLLMLLLPLLLLLLLMLQSPMRNATSLKPL